MAIYSIKMRASANEKHLSGAEKLIPERQLEDYTRKLLYRGLKHPKGDADLLNIKIEKVNEDNVLFLDALSVRTITVDTWQQGVNEIRHFLEILGVGRSEEILGLLKKTYAMRGAMLLDVDTLERLEPNPQRGIRATYMDLERDTSRQCGDSKNHYEEALVLATKVAYAPGIIGEICISDDPDYVTGYVASREIGYRRITKMKEMGSENGGRIFLYRGGREQAANCIRFLEKQVVVVRNVKPLSAIHTQNVDKWNFIKETLSGLEKRHLYRSMKEIQSAQSSNITCQGKKMVLMASNSYLDMATVAEVKKYASEVLDEYGTGSGGSRLTTGNTTIHYELESAIAKFEGTEAALVLNSGYVANLSIISALMGKEDTIFSDELNHASIIDGCRLSGAKIVVYKHNDMKDLEEKIRLNPCRKGLIVSDAVFSMDGDILKLPEFLEIADVYNLLSMIDEAHSLGVLGKTGRGIAEHFGITKQADLVMGTLSKAIGSEGGFVCGKRELIEYLKNRARGFIFSTSLPPVTMAASTKAFDFMRKNPERVRKLQYNIRFFCKCLKAAGIHAQSETAIIPVIIGNEEKTLRVAERLFAEGFFISAIRYPTVKRGSARLRITLMATHTEAELKKAAAVIGKILREEEAVV